MQQNAAINLLLQSATGVTLELIEELDVFRCLSTEQGDSQDPLDGRDDLGECGVQSNQLVFRDV